MDHSLLTRRQTLAALASTAAMPFLSACARTVGAAPLAPPPTVAPPPATTDATAKALLDSVAENLLRLSPESATGLGIDTGARAPLRYQLGDRSALGQQRLASVLAADFNRAEALDVKIRYDISERENLASVGHAPRWST